MKNYFYYVLTRKSKEGKYWNEPAKIHQSLNIRFLFQDDSIEHIYQCKTQREAIQTATAWNQSELDNGTYIFDRLYSNAIIQNY